MRPRGQLRQRHCRNRDLGGQFGRADPAEVDHHRRADEATLVTPASHLAAEGVLVSDGEGRIVYLNGAAARLVGFASAEEVYGLPLAEVRNAFEIFDGDGVPLDPTSLPAARARRGEGASELLVRFRPRAG